MSTGYANFLNNKISICCEPDRPNSVFFSCKMPKKSTLKARLKVCGKSLHLLFGLEKKPTFQPKFTSAEAYSKILLAFISCIQAIFNLLMWVGSHGQTGIGT